MKKVLSLLFICSAFIASNAFATGTTTSMHSWTCTTNASSSDKESDKVADKKMSEQAASATKSFGFAAKHCRNCTKITCETK